MQLPDRETVTYCEPLGHYAESMLAQYIEAFEPPLCAQIEALFTSRSALGPIDSPFRPVSRDLGAE